MEQQFILHGVIGGKQVAALFVAQAHMDVHAGAGPLGVGLGHEGCGHAVLFGGGLDQALEHDAFIAGLQHIGAVAQDDFHLPRCIFRDQGFRRQPLRLAIGVEVLEEGGEVIEVLQVIGLVVLRAMLVDQ